MWTLYVKFYHKTQQTIVGSVSLLNTLAIFPHHLTHPGDEVASNWSRFSELRIFMSFHNVRNIITVMTAAHSHYMPRFLILAFTFSYWKEENIEGKRRPGRRRKQLLDDVKERRMYWKLDGEAPDRTLWRTCFGIFNGFFVRQTTEWWLWFNVK